MPRKKEPAKPMFAVKHDFVESLDNLCQQTIMLLQVTKTLTEDDCDGKAFERLKPMLKERADALEKALSSDA